MSEAGSDLNPSVSEGKTSSPQIHPRHIFISVGLVAGVFAVTFALIFYASPNRSSSIFLLLIYALPAALLLTRQLVWTENANQQSPEQRIRRWIIKLYFGLGMWGLSIGFIGFLNVQLASPEATNHVVTVSKKQKERTRRGRPVRKLIYPSPVSPGITFLPEDYGTLVTKRASYKSAERGVTQIALKIRTGFFGIPWVEEAQIVNPE